MLSVRVAAALLVTLLAAALAACGDDGDDERGGPAPASARTATTAAASAARALLTERPQVELDLGGGESDELPAVELRGGAGASTRDSYRLRLTDGDAARAPARRSAEPGTAAVAVVATVRDPTRLDGRAGVFCRGSADGRTGYELTVDRRGRVRLERVQEGRRTLLAGYDARIDAPVSPEEPLPLVLACGTGTERGPGVTLGIGVGVRQMTFIGDRRPLDPGSRGHAGLVVGGGPPATADFAAFQLYLARP